MERHRVVTYISPVEAFTTGIKILIGEKCAWSLDRPFWGPWSLDFLRVKGQIVAAHSWSLIFTVRRSPWSLDRLSKSALITWFCFDPGRKRFYTGHISDYPLKGVWFVCRNLHTLLGWGGVASSLWMWSDRGSVLPCWICRKNCALGQNWRQFQAPTQQFNAHPLFN